MPVTIREITSEVVLAAEPRKGAAESADLRPEAREELLDALVTQAAERVIERLRLEWDR